MISVLFHLLPWFVRVGVIQALMLTLVSAADFGMEWLPLPEAYTWPAPEKDAAEFKLEQVSVRELPAAIQALLKKAAEGHSLPATVEKCRVDLNGDGEAEWILSVPPLSALGGEVYVLIRRKPEGHVILGIMQGHLAFLEPTSGWVQIASLAKDGAERFSRSLWQYHDGKYRVVRREDHDFRVQRLTVIDGLDKNAR
jgi:hypothetical protein